VQSVIRRGAETKQRWSWAQGERTGSIYGFLGRVMGCYIKAVREEIPHFPIVFLSLLFLTNKSSLLSPTISSSSPTAGKGVPAVVGRPVRRHHRVGALFFIFFVFF